LEVDTSLNITPFMNLMVVLIPFLLTGVVFSKLAVMDLNLPSASASERSPSEAQEPLRLIVTLHSHEITIRGSGLGVTRLPSQEERHNLKGLAGILQRVKTAHPTEKSVIILSEPDIPYESLVEVMDTCRGNSDQELFPDISIGEVKKS
jgi:biopolymer transport protein ExbD